MNIDLLELPTKQLLDKIGAGNHKPGSGSAAALNGILSCKLLMTVIELTLEPKRAKTYSHCKKEFEEIRTKIIGEIGLNLEHLFEEDSKQFDKAIQKRKERDNETNQKLKNDFQEESLYELKRSTEIPIEIANLCILLAKYSIIIFEKGFKSARGDSGVALGSSLSALSGCISIINLNLRSFPKNTWTESIKLKREELKYELTFLSKENFRLNDILEKEAERNGEFLAEFIEIKKTLYGKITYDEIEDLARRIQNALWEYQDLIWGIKAPKNLVGLLKPEKVIYLLKYAFHKVDTLGVNESNEEIAGIIDNKNFTIRISKKYKPETINFTQAHELGHALMHNKLELHRDMPLDGSTMEKFRSQEEMQADKFAAAFLMPKKIVAEIFEDLFGLKRFTLNETTAQALNRSSLHDLSKKVKTKRDLSRMIAKCEFYNHQPFTSLSSIFQVSIEAMAIRIEELNLV
jgi:formiminotetrahydrofolate cyclodeaminase/Zn-dependent peptidase ImmA (M78 family)